jgi:hypothetical protein
MTPLEIEIEKNVINHNLHLVLKDCKFNGATMREVLQKFTDEVCGS